MMIGARHAVTSHRRLSTRQPAASAHDGEPSVGDSAAVPSRVVIVDDNDAMRACTTSLLADEFQIVGTAINGDTAIAVITALQPDVVVLDISLPDMSGFEVAALLRRMGSKSAIVFLTVHDQDDLVEAARAVGAVGYVVKSRMLADLPAAVHAGANGSHRPPIEGAP